MPIVRSSLTPCAGSVLRPILEHDPEKWVPVFGKDHAQTRRLKSVEQNEETMRAVGYRQSLPIENPEPLTDIEGDKPAPQGRDLLVAVKAISVNPVDYKVRKRAAPKEGEPAKILGYDATGVVAADRKSTRLN